MYIIKHNIDLLNKFIGAIMLLRKKLFRICLEANALTQAEFANKIGCTSEAISRFFAGYKSEPIRRKIDMFISQSLHTVKDQLKQFEKTA